MTEERPPYNDRMMRPGRDRIPLPAVSGRYFVVQQPGSGARPEPVYWHPDIGLATFHRADGEVSLQPQPEWIWYGTQP